jgi:hypothetical protein
MRSSGDPGVNTPLLVRGRLSILETVARAVSKWFPKCLDLRQKPTFRIVVAYEDSETARHARNVCDYMVKRPGPQCQFIGQMWGFDVLQVPECRELAAKGAASADVIMLSSHGTRDLPGEVKAWIELWLRDKGDLQALVALLDHPHTYAGPSWPIQDYLAGVAERGQIPFFVEPDTWPGKGPQQIHLPLEPISDGGTPPFLPLESAAAQRHEAAHWGINE